MFKYQTLYETDTNTWEIDIKSFVEYQDFVNKMGLDNGQPIIIDGVLCEIYSYDEGDEYPYLQITLNKEKLITIIAVDEAVNNCVVVANNNEIVKRITIEKIIAGLNEYVKNKYYIN